MAELLDVADLEGHTGPGCAHDKLKVVRAALVAWRGTAAFGTAFANLKTQLEAVVPGVTWTNARVARVVSVLLEGRALDG